MILSGWETALAVMKHTLNKHCQEKEGCVIFPMPKIEIRVKNEASFDSFKLEEEFKPNTPKVDPNFTTKDGDYEDLVKNQWGYKSPDLFDDIKTSKDCFTRNFDQYPSSNKVREFSPILFSDEE